MNRKPITPERAEQLRVATGLAQLLAFFTGAEYRVVRNCCPPSLVCMRYLRGDELSERRRELRPRDGVANG